MHIKSIEVNNFKSLVEFKLDLVKFNCLIGLNGSGKSTVLQFIDFLSQLVRGDMKGWLAERHWKLAELKSTFNPKKNIRFSVWFQDDEGRSAGHWEAQYSPSVNRCLTERIDMLDYVLETTANEVNLVKVKSDNSKGRKPWRSDITLDFEGSILSSVKQDLLSESIRSCKQFLLRSESLDMLTPERLRQRTRNAEGSLGHGGRNLSAFMYELGPTGRKALAKKLKEAYPQLGHVYAKSLRSGWKQLQASEIFGDVKIRTEARHLNDGMLRLIAILAEIASDHDFVLFDEIENGINPELVEFVINVLVKARQQVLVTTHSPMILNYLDDETAKKGVIYLYKTPQGHTKSIPFFSIASLARKLTVMGPGEAFVDTNLTQLADEIAGLNGEEA